MFELITYRYRRKIKMKQKNTKKSEDSGSFCGFHSYQTHFSTFAQVLSVVLKLFLNIYFSLLKEKYKLNLFIAILFVQKDPLSRNAACAIELFQMSINLRLYVSFFFIVHLSSVVNMSSFFFLFFFFNYKRTEGVKSV